MMFKIICIPHFPYVPCDLGAYVPMIHGHCGPEPLRNDCDEVGVRIEQGKSPHILCAIRHCTRRWSTVSSVWRHRPHNWSITGRILVKCWHTVSLSGRSCHMNTWTLEGTSSFHTCFWGKCGSICMLFRCLYKTFYNHILWPYGCE